MAAAVEDAERRRHHGVDGRQLPRARERTVAREPDILLECEIVRASTGRYPEQVESRDPLTGQPFAYDRAAGWIRSVRSGNSPKDGLEWRLRRSNP
jgi:hypothetical protein